ncbi:ABC transporter ATP-binding protein [Saccharopolyspora spinosa]|uniref:ABC transporter ATP-binding protein n=1 Tax=Saccharopolyspora spinosa TaxID=60894 RepID=UPI0002378D3D|nr:ABC transporter ATP-binding protein [Saccharopolyspora spinosa]
MGVEVVVDGLSKSFGAQTIWRDVTLTLPPGEISVLLGPSGTGKSVFLKSLVGLLKPEHGKVVINGVDICACPEHDLYEIRKLFGVLFQDGALFGSMNLYDNIAFPLREHTRKSESEIREVALEKMEMVGLIGAEEKLPGEISGGMRKRAGLARALVLDPEIILVDEPDSGLDPVVLLNQLIVDLNAQIDATILIVTHDINTARTVPDNIGMLYRRNLVMFGPREVLLTSAEPAVVQFLNGRPDGPIGMSEEKDVGESELARLSEVSVPPMMPQLDVSPGLPARSAVRRRKDRVLRQLRTLSPSAQQEILKTLTPDELALHGFSVPATGSWPQRTEPVQAQPDRLPQAQVAGVPQQSRPTPYPRQPQPEPEPESEVPPWAAGPRPAEPAGTPRRRWFGRKRGEQ